MSRPSEPQDDLPWPAPAHRPSRAELSAPATQIVRDREDYLGQGSHDVGRRIAADQLELFVVGDPAHALQQQLARLAPQYVALHDVGVSATVQLLSALAGAAGAPLQRLSMRRQGHGVALALLQFVEVPLPDGDHVRIYSTDVNADTQTRLQLAEVLLSHSRLAVLMLGDLPAHVLTSAFKPLAHALAQPAWLNRDLLLLPLASSSTLAMHANRLAGDSGVSVRVTPHAATPDAAWAYVSGAWNRLQAERGSAVALNTELALAVPKPELPSTEAATQAMPLSPDAAMALARQRVARRPDAGPSARASAPPSPRRGEEAAEQSAARGGAAPLVGPSPHPPAVRRRKAASAADRLRWADYAQRCAAVSGVTSCCVFDLSSQLPLAHAGGPPAAERLAIQGGLLLDGMADAARILGLPTGTPEAAISVGDHHLLLRPVPGHPGIVLHLVVQAAAGKLTLARLQLERVRLPG